MSPARLCFKLVYPDPGAPLHEERMIAVCAVSKLHLEFYQRDVTDGMTLFWSFLLMRCQRVFWRWSKVPRNS